jgi:hypothetical protein
MLVGLNRSANMNKKTIVSHGNKGLNSRVLLDMIVPDLHELLLSVVHVREIVDHLARLDLQPLGIRPKAWQNKKRKKDYAAHAQHFAYVDLQLLGIPPKTWRIKNGSMFRMRMILLLLIFSHSGSGLKHGKIKKRSMLCMRRMFLLLIFSHSGSGLKHDEIKTGVCCACAGFFSC